MKAKHGSRSYLNVARLVVFLITVALLAGMSGCGGEPAPKPDYVEIWNWDDLNAIREDLGGHYRLMTNLDSSTQGYDNGGGGWQPIGGQFSQFTGIFDGQEYEIRDLVIDRRDEENVGLFGYVSGGQIRNVRLVDVNVIGNKIVGGLVGDHRGTVTNSYSSGSVTGQDSVGGLVGYSLGGTLQVCESAATVSSESWRAGGLVGHNSLYGNVLLSHYSGDAVTGRFQVGGLVGLNAGQVIGSSGTGTVTGAGAVGGVAGRNLATAWINGSHFDGTVNGGGSGSGLVLGLDQGILSSPLSSDVVPDGSYIGGLVGWNEGAVDSATASATVTGLQYVGGLVGGNDGIVDSSYARGSVTGHSYVGGLVGWNQGSVASSFAAAQVGGLAEVGGLVGRNEETGIVAGSFWDTVSSGVADTESRWGVGKTTSELMDVSTYQAQGWDICQVAVGVVNTACAWNIAPGGYPFLSGKQRDLPPEPPLPPTPEPRIMINPFAIAEIREAMNWLIDREFMVEEHLGGLGVAKYTALHTAFPDYVERYPHIIKAIEAEYAYNPNKARQVITEKMEEYGAVFERGRWYYDSQLVEIIVLIRADLAPYPQAGHYVADQLEWCGFEVQRLVLPGPEAHPIWQGPLLPLRFHVYTGGWGVTAIQRDQGGLLDVMYTHRAFRFPLWQELESDLETDFALLNEASLRLARRDFITMAGREALFETVLWEAMRFSNQVWTVDVAGATPMRHQVRLLADKAADFSGARLWAHSIHFHNNLRPYVADQARVAHSNLLIQPWNPVAGPSSRYDLWVTLLALGDAGLLPDTNTGFYYPQRIQRAEVTFQAGLPVGVSTDWLTMNFAHSIPVPGDAWADWDPVQQRFITVAEKFPGGVTAAARSVVYYPKDIFDHPCHDGSTLSLGDFLLSAIIRFDRGKEDSPVYDPAAASAHDSFMAAFKGVRFITSHPGYGLIVEDYRDHWELDAESCVWPWFPSYGSYGQSAPWHTIAISWLAEQDGVMAWSEAKAGSLGVETTDFTRGGTLAMLKSYLDQAQAASFIPYPSFLGTYITSAEIAQRYANLQAFYAQYGHFWADFGIFRLKSVRPVERVIVLERFPEYPDPADKWFFLFDPSPVNVPAHTGAWVNEVIVSREENHGAAVSRLKAGDLDVFAWPVRGPALVGDILANLSYELSYGVYCDIRFNTVGDPYYQTG